MHDLRTQPAQPHFTPTRRPTGRLHRYTTSHTLTRSPVTHLQYPHSPDGSPISRRPKKFFENRKHQRNAISPLQALPMPPPNIDLFFHIEKIWRVTC